MIKQGSSMTPAKALEKAIEICGSQTELAKRIGMSQQLVSYWVSTGRGIPAEHIGRVSKATKIPVKQLRADIFEGVK